MTRTYTSKLGSRLVERGYLSEAQLWRALEAQRASGGRLGTVLLEQKLISEQRLLEALAAPHNTESASVDDLRDIAPEILRLVPPKVALRLQVVPFRVVGPRAYIATKDPSSIPTMDELSFVTGKRVQMFAAAELRIEEALAKHYGKALSARIRQALERANAGAAEAAASVSSTQQVAPLPDPSPAPPAASGFGALEIPEAPRPSQRNPGSARRSRESAGTGESQPIAAPLASVQAASQRLVEQRRARESAGQKATSELRLDAEASRETPIAALEPSAPTAPPAPPAPVPVAVIPATATLEPAPPPPPKRLMVALKPSERARLREDPVADKPAETRADRDRIAADLVADVRKLLTRVLLFRVRGEEIEGWMGSPEIEAEALKKFRARFSELPIFLGLQQGSRFYLGPLPPMASHRRLAALWGGELPRDGVAVPIKLGERLVALLYGDRGKDGLSGLPLADLEGSVANAERALESAITRGKRSAS